MKNTVALARAVGPALSSCELTFLEREPIDLARASEQHDQYCDALRAAGVSVHVLPTDDRLPDAVFVEDAAIVIDELAVIARPGIDSRREEVPVIAEALSNYRTLVTIEPPGTLEGGDVLQVGRRIFVGASLRSNRSGFAQLSSYVKPLGYEPVQVEVNGCLHLKTAVTALSPDTLLVNPHWIDSSQLIGFRTISVPGDEPFAANSLRLGNVIYLSSTWRRTRDVLDMHGFTTKIISVSEFEKAEAGLTCLSLIFSSGAGQGGVS